MWKLKIAKGDDPYLYSINNFVGRQIWEFDPHAGTPDERQQVEDARQCYRNNRIKGVHPGADLLMRMQLIKENGIDVLSIPPVRLREDEEVNYEAVTTAVKKAIRLNRAIQAHDGHWPAEFSGPIFYTPPLLIVMYISGTINTHLTKEHKTEMIRYIYNHQNEDGGWGFHIEGHSTMMGSALSYVALRLLGEGVDDGNGAVERARKWILDHGGATSIPSWGKAYLSRSELLRDSIDGRGIGIEQHMRVKCSGCMNGKGAIHFHQSTFWLFPKVLPFHLAKMWCFCRTTYMPMSYLYGRKYHGPITDLITQIRQEIHTIPYDEINWNKQRHNCCKEDLYVSHSKVQDLLWDSLHYLSEPLFKYWPFTKLRERGIKRALDLLRYNSQETRYIASACVEKSLQMMCWWAENPNGDEFKHHLASVPDYLWLAEDGMKMQGCGSQVWDCTLATQAIIASNMVEEFGDSLKKAHIFIKDSQIKQNSSGDFSKMYKPFTKGSWTFSDLDQGWGVSDCTAEALKVTVY
ncbi:hypothetical protein QVD17_18073 [Tagetes erecta]|uniref:Squalene cyclase N-terminal domain-containing protein n=1 Tax=Tagetes erecta TaxID=13708 RepID=A0AAD8KKH5_TARER|nr:hypothetical protein QVD17_18073 [Tagetes erecta]